MNFLKYMFNNNIIINKINFEDMQELINNDCIIIKHFRRKITKLFNKRNYKY